MTDTGGDADVLMETAFFRSATAVGRRLSVDRSRKSRGLGWRYV